MTPSRRRPRIALVWAGVLGLHLALVAVLVGSRQRPEAHPVPHRVALRLITTAPVPEAPPAVVPERPRRTGSAPPRAAPRMRSTPPMQAPAPITTTQAVAPTPVASAPDAQPSLLDADATHRAIRASARAPSLSDQLARSREEPARASANDRLATGVRSAGKGDCMKGEFAGAGLGLLSLPFLAVAAASGDCAK